MPAMSSLLFFFISLGYVFFFNLLSLSASPSPPSVFLFRSPSLFLPLYLSLSTLITLRSFFLISSSTKTVTPNEAGEPDNVVLRYFPT